MICIGFKGSFTSFYSVWVLLGKGYYHFSEERVGPCEPNTCVLERIGDRKGFMH